MQTTMNTTTAAPTLVPLSYLLSDYVQTRKTRKAAEECIPNALYWDINSHVRTETTEKFASFNMDWQPVSIAVTCDAIYVRHAPTFPTLSLVGSPELNQKISKFRIMRRWTEDTERGTAIKLRYRDAQREVREIEVRPSDRSRFLTALAVGFD